MNSLNDEEAAIDTSADEDADWDYNDDRMS